MNVSSRTKLRFVIMATLALCVASVGCGDSSGDGGDGGDGGAGGTGGTGAVGGTGGTGGALDISNPDVLAALVASGRPLVAEITAVDSDANPVEVSFTLSTQGGAPVAGLEGTDDPPGANVRGTFAKLEPGATEDEASGWMSYINVLRDASGEGASVPTALQATREEGSSFVGNGDGSYVFTFATDVTDVTEPVPVSWAPGETNRVGLEIRLSDLINPDNPTYDFVPDGGQGESKSIASTLNCNNCHQRLAFHGGARFTEEYCVTCHNTGTRDPEGGEVLDMAYMTHSIHASEVREALDEPYIVVGRGGTVHDYSEVTYPQDVRGSPSGETVPCQTCHQEDSDSPQGDAWGETVNSLACGGCHADKLIVSAPDPTTGLSTYRLRHVINGEQINQPDSSCRSCHNNPDLFPDLVTAERHTILELAAAKAFEYRIVAVSNTAASEFPEVSFQIVNPENGDAPYDLTETDGPFDIAKWGGTARLAVMLAWPSNEYNNLETGSATAGFRPGSPAQNVSMDPLTACVPPLSGCTDDGDGQYTITSPVAVPEGLSTGDSLAVAIEGHPAVDVDEDGTAERIPVTGLVEYFEMAEGSAPGTAREQIVSIDRCNDCHSVLSLHGNNRTDSIELCVTCHNANATDIRARAEGGAAGEQSIDFKNMIHGIHNASVEIYGFGGSLHDYTEVTYPGQLYNCDACHEGDTFYPTDPSTTFRYATTIISDNFSDADDPEAVVPTVPGTPQREATLANQEDDLNWTPNASACLACHTSDVARSHSEIPGSASFSAKQSNDGTLLAPRVETCHLCHGAGSSVADTAVFHQPPFD